MSGSLVAAEDWVGVRRKKGGCKAKRAKDRGDGAWGRVRELVEVLRAQGTTTYIQTPREAPPAKAPRRTFAALIFSKCLHASHHGDSQMKSCSCRCDAHFSDRETNPDVILVGGRTTHITLYRNMLSGVFGFPIWCNSL